MRRLREVKRRYPDTAVIMLTGVSEVSTAVECLQEGAMDYLSKPVLIEVPMGTTLRQIVKGGRAAFYEGEIASKIVAEMAAHDGLITAQDLADTWSARGRNSSRATGRRWSSWKQWSPRQLPSAPGSKSAGRSWTGSCGSWMQRCKSAAAWYRPWPNSSPTNGPG